MNYFQLAIIALVGALGCKPSADSGLQDAATTSSYKTGFFLPQLASDYAFRHSGKEVSSSKALARKIGVNLVEDQEYFTTISARGEQFLITYKPNSRKQYPIVVGSYYQGKRYKYLAHLLPVKDGLKITDTFLRSEVGKKPILKVEDMFLLRQPRSFSGVLEPMLVPWLNHVRSETSGKTLYRVGNDVIGTHNDSVALSFDPIGNQVWRVRGTYWDKDLASGAIIWTKDHKTFFSMRPKFKRITVWKKQDRDSMDRVKSIKEGSSEYPKIPNIVVRELKDYEKYETSDFRLGSRGIDACTGDRGVVQLHRICKSVASAISMGLLSNQLGDLTPDDDDFYEYPGNRSDAPTHFGLEDSRVRIGSTSTTKPRQWVSWQGWLDNKMGQSMDMMPKPIADANRYLRNTKAVQMIKNSTIHASDATDSAVVATFRGERNPAVTKHNVYYNKKTNQVEIDSHEIEVDGSKYGQRSSPVTTRTMSPEAYQATLEADSGPDAKKRLEALRKYNAGVESWQKAFRESGDEMAKAQQDNFYSGEILTNAAISAATGAVTDKVMPDLPPGASPNELVKQAAKEGVADFSKKIVTDTVNKNLDGTAEDKPTPAEAGNYLYDLGQEVAIKPVATAAGMGKLAPAIKFGTEAAQRHANGKLAVTPGTIVKAGVNYTSGKIFKRYGPAGEAMDSVVQDQVGEGTGAMADYLTNAAFEQANRSNQVTEQNLRRAQIDAPVQLEALNQATNSAPTPSPAQPTPATQPQAPQGVTQYDQPIGPPTYKEFVDANNGNIGQ